MLLTLAQKQAIKTWILASPTPLFDTATRDALNAPASPVYWVWAAAVDRHTITDKKSLDTDGTTPTAFAWGGATGAGSYIDRNPGERDAWDQLFNTTGRCKPYLGNVRKAFADIFSGNGADAVANRKHLWGSGQRQATVLEKLIAPAWTAGDGPNQTGARGSKTNPDIPGIGTDGEPVEGAITLNEVVAIFSVPL
jgi:hypothetical protein